MSTPTGSAGPASSGGGNAGIGTGNAASVGLGIGGDGGPSSASQTVNPVTGAQTFNFNAPRASLLDFGTGTSATIIKGTVALVLVIGVVALGSKWLGNKSK